VIVTTVVRCERLGVEGLGVEATVSWSMCSGSRVMGLGVGRLARRSRFVFDSKSVFGEWFGL
jgi:hypothetical protein